MKFLKIIIITISFLTITSCQDLVDGINEDPNNIIAVNGDALLTGMQLADVTSQSGFLTWAGGVSCGYFVGSGRLRPIQDYSYVDTDSNTSWRNIYVGVVNQAKELRSGIPVTNKSFFYGVSKIIEAHAIGTATNVFGKVPFTEAGLVPTPKYDEQIDVYNGLQNLLDTAITDLQTANSSGGISEDIFFGGNSSKWIKVAYTLKARFYLDVRAYDNAMIAAQNGISSESETMKYSPLNTAGGGDINLLNALLESSTFGGDVSVANSYLIKLIGTGTESRDNTKTIEVDRAAFYYNGTNINQAGIAAPDTAINQISLQENLLTWAESALRTNPSANFNTALDKLNAHRKNLRDGEYFPVTANTKYDDYTIVDFESGGIENVDGSLSKENALLREILEERYVTFFTEILGFNDQRRVEKDTPVNVRVAVPYNKGNQYPQRFLYPFSEANTNEANVPNVADIFVKTQINQ